MSKRNFFLKSFQCTDPDELQFCKEIQEGKIYEYCQFVPTTYSDERLKEIFNTYCGDPNQLIEDCEKDEKLRKIVSTKAFYHETIDISLISNEDKKDIISMYGLRSGGNEKLTENELNQLICEGYFEQYCINDCFF